MLRQIPQRFCRAVDDWRLRPALHVLRWTVPIGIVAYLAYTLAHLGWAHVWAARPRMISFYAILALQFFLQPVADLLIYRNLLGAGKKLRLNPFLRKQYLNTVMLEYSGEAYWYFWAKRNLHLEKGDLLHAVKDSNILSAGAGLTMVWVMLLALLESRIISLPALTDSHIWRGVFVASLPLVLCLVLVAGGKKVTALSRGDIAATFSIHVARSFAALSLDFLLWWISGALPSAALCLEFVALRLLVTRLPLVPNKDLVFIGVGIAVSGPLDVSASKVAAVLVITAAFVQLQNFLLVGLPWFLSRFRLGRNADQIAS
jgi:hypothetical protein